MGATKYYLYRHIRLDKNEPFYIGIGTKCIKFKHHSIKSEYKRAYSKGKRNNLWYKIVNKAGYKVDILIESNDYNFIKKKEVEFIKLYGRKDLRSGTLCNMTDGGEGSVNIITSFKHKLESSKRMKLLNKNRDYTKVNNPNYLQVLNLETGIYYNNLKEAYKSQTVLKYHTFIKLLKNKDITKKIYLILD